MVDQNILDAIQKNKFHFEDNQLRHSKLDVDYAAKHSLRIHPSLLKLAEVTSRHPASIMMGSLDEMQLLQNLVRCIGAKKTLEIGVFTGVSTLAIALGLPEDGKIVACDISEEYARIGFPYWKEAGVFDKITFVQGPADRTLQKLIDNEEAGTYDFAFIDADKGNYSSYYEKCLQLIRKNGIIAIDNTLWGGSVYNTSIKDDSTEALRRLNKKIHLDDRVYVSFLTIGDGTSLVFKK